MGIKTSTILNTAKLRNKEFIDLIPEIYELEKVIENDNHYHNNDSVFDHIMSVLKGLEEILKSIKEKVSDYLSQKITNYSRKELLFLTILFHDIGKKETMIKDSNGFTSCPGHAEKSATKAENFLSCFDLSEKEKDLVSQIIKYHMLLYLIVKPENNKINEQFNGSKVKHPNIFLELVLLAMADILGTQLEENNQWEFNFVINFYERFLTEY
ncbi:MAG TPA: HD domain-containing protein [bacterium]|nr:HD domain-containing protein [bacterium]